MGMWKDLLGTTINTFGIGKGKATITAAGLTAARTVTLPDKSGMVAMTSDITGTNSGTNTGDQTNIAGNAATVTTNANLTGPITSTGNATAVAAQTGTGSTFVMQASPNFTGNVGMGTTSPSVKLQIASGDVAIDSAHAYYSYGQGSASNLTNALWTSFYNDGTYTQILTAGIGTSAAAIGDIRFSKYNGSTVTPLMAIQASTGNVGMGTTGQITKLAVVNTATGFTGDGNRGDLYINGSSVYGAGIEIIASGTNGTKWNLLATANSYPGGGGLFVMADNSSNTQPFIIYSASGVTNTLVIKAGNVGVGLAPSANKLEVDGTIKTKVYTVSTLPSASTVGAGARAYVSDANSIQFQGVVVGGGANSTPVYSDGANWRQG